MYETSAGSEKESRVGVSVVTDSTSYIPREMRDEFGIGVVALTSVLDGVSYLDDAEDCEAFFEALAASRSFPTSSLPAVSAIEDQFESRVAKGDAVVGVFISQRMSGTYDTAMLARDRVLERNPGAVIEVVDGKSNSMELGFAVLAAARTAVAGGTVAEVVAAAEEMTRHTRFLFTPLTLEYLRRGGRIGGAAAVLGTILQLKPVLTAANGATAVAARVRSLRRAHDEIVSLFEADIREHGGLAEAYVQHANDPVAGLRFADRIAEVAGRPVGVLPIGPAVGTHVGPGSVGVVYQTNERMR